MEAFERVGSLVALLLPSIIASYCISAINYILLHLPNPLYMFFLSCQLIQENGVDADSTLASQQWRYPLYMFFLSRSAVAMLPLVMKFRLGGYLMGSIERVWWSSGGSWSTKTKLSPEFEDMLLMFYKQRKQQCNELLSNSLDDFLKCCILERYLGNM